MSIRINGKTYRNGTVVRANPVEEATGTLEKIGIGSDVYEIQGSGTNGGSAYTETVLWENSSGLSFKPNDTKTISLANDITSYDALSFVFGGSTNANSKATFIISTSDLINYSNEGVLSICTRGSINYNPVTYYIDNTHLMFGGWTNSETCYAYKVTGIKYGGNLSPVIYSTEEREVGVWTDNKPLYQKTITFTNVSGTRNSLDLNIANVDYIGLVIEGSSADNRPLPYVTGTDYTNNIGGFFDIQTNTTTFEWRAGSGSTSSTDIVLTVQYTKTTDIAGSGSYNTLGVPTVHYTTDEQVIGTYTDGNGVTKPVYQKTQIGGISLTSVGVWYDTSFTNIDQVLDVKGTILRDDEQINLGYFTNTLGTCWICRNNNIKIQLAARNSGETYALDKLTIQYTKTTD